MRTRTILSAVVLLIAAKAIANPPVWPIPGSTSQANTWGTLLINQMGKGGLCTNVTHPDFAAAGDGVTDDAAAIAAAEAVADDAGGVLFFPPGNYKIASSVATSANVTLRFAPGAKISGITSSVQLTIAGAVEAGPYQIFDATYSETTEQVILSSRTREVCPEWWGAVGDGATDDTTALRQAFQVAAIANVDSPTVVVLRSKYEITKPLFLGHFIGSKNGDGQDGFTWAGETRYWGGNISDNKEGLIVVGRPCFVYEPAGIIASHTTGVPMIVIVGGRKIVFEDVYMAGDAGAAKATEGVFISGGSWYTTFRNCNIEGCERGLRLGNNRHWTDDPVTFTGLDPAATLALGGWMVENTSGYDTHLEGTVALSSETQQAIHTEFNASQFFADTASATSYPIYMAAGRLRLNNAYFYGPHTGADIYSPAVSGYEVGYSRMEINGAWSESTATCFIDENYGYATGMKYLIITGVSIPNHNIDLTIQHRVTWIGGSISNVYYRGSTSTSYPGSLVFVNTAINGVVGNMRSADAAATSYLTFTGCEFTADSTATPWYGSYTPSAHIELNACAFTGDSFTCGTSPNQRINWPVAAYNTAVSHDYSGGSSDWTLTDVEAAANEFSTTNAGGAVNMIFPRAQPGKGLFVVANGSGSTQTVKVIGQTGITIANGKTSILRFSATDVVEVYEQP